MPRNMLHAEEREVKQGTCQTKGHAKNRDKNEHCECHCLQRSQPLTCMGAWHKLERRTLQPRRGRLLQWPLQLCQNAGRRAQPHCQLLGNELREGDACTQTMITQVARRRAQSVHSRR